MTDAPSSRSLPEVGTYRAARPGGGDAVALASLRTVVGPLHLRLPVLAGELVVGPTLEESWLAVDLDGSAVTSTLLHPVRRVLDPRLGRALDLVRLETFSLEEVGDRRLRAHADLYAAGGLSEVAVDLRLVELAQGRVRLSVEGRFPRSVLGLDRGGRLAAASVRFVLALHGTLPRATVRPAKPKARRSGVPAGAAA